jgi:hypothetical protein
MALVHFGFLGPLHALQFHSSMESFGRCCRFSGQENTGFEFVSHWNIGVKGIDQTHGIQTIAVGNHFVFDRGEHQSFGDSMKSDYRLNISLKPTSNFFAVEGSSEPIRFVSLRLSTQRN